MFSLQILLGRVCTIAELHKKELPIVVRVSDNAQFDCPSSSSKSTDHVAKRYLQDLLQEISQAGGGELIPVGVEIHLELLENADWYMGKMSLYHNVSNDSNCADFPDLICATAAVGCSLSTTPGNTAKKKAIAADVHLFPAFTEEEYDELLRAAVPDYADHAEWSPFEHCQVMSNILKRPVCLFTSLRDLDRQESFIFLPLRHPPEECYKHPMSIAWQKRGENNELSHFVPLCRTMDSAAPLIPSHCQPPIYRSSKEIAMQYIDYREDSSFAIGMPVLYSEIEPTHLFNTMGCRFKPHKPKQPGFFHGLIDKLISASYQELSKENALKNLFLLCSSLDSGDGRQGLQSPSEVIATDLLIKLHISRIGFDSVALCATSSAEMSLCDSLQETTRNILHMHSVEKDRQSSNCGSSNSFKLEIDEHVVTAMNKIYSLKIVTDSALKDYMKYVQSVHIDTLVRGEYGKFVTSRSRAIAASSKAGNDAVLSVDADSAESKAGAGTVSIHACTSTALITTDVTPSVPNGHHEVGMTDSEQQTLVYLSRCKAIASKHVKNMKTNLLSAFSSQEALAWSQGRSRNRIERTEESGLQASMKHNCESESTYFPGSSVERPVLQPVMSPAECASSVSSHPDEVTKSQKKRSIGDI